MMIPNHVYSYRPPTRPPIYWPSVITWVAMIAVSGLCYGLAIAWLEDWLR